MPGAWISLAIGAMLGTPDLAQEGRWHRELPESYGIDFLAPLPALPPHLHSPWPSPPLVRPPDQVRALYVNAWAFGGSRFRELIRLADESEVNALVIDVKDDTGFLTYPSRVPTAVAIGAHPGQHTEVVTLDSELLQVQRDGDQVLASVRFSGLIREEAGGPAQPFDVVWHVRHAWNTRDGDWLIAGIQQVG